MYYGAQFSKRVDYNLSNISHVVSNYIVLLLDESSCKYYGVIKASLRKKGKPIPENDIWIAAVALQHDLIVATRNIHFYDVEGLSIERW